MSGELATTLQNFAKEKGFRGKGALSVALVVTKHAQELGLPLKSEELLVDRGGQVRGLGMSTVQAILAKHQITRVLAKEGGRTSRGSIDNMRAYVEFLNGQYATGQLTDLNVVEKFWIDRVREFFAGKPFSLKADSGLSIRAVIRNLMAQAIQRQKEVPGVMYAGTMMQHLIGAKLDIVLASKQPLKHHGSNDNDENNGRTGDFDVGDVSIHVSTAPTEALLRKCQENLGAGRRPMIITTQKGTAVAEGLASNIDILERLEIIEFEQFVAANIHELGGFESTQRTLRIGELIDRYNAIVAEYETDPSLKIEAARGR